VQHLHDPRRQWLDALRHRDCQQLVRLQPNGDVGQHLADLSRAGAL